jgi:site-specific recombinase XerD
MRIFVTMEVSFFLQGKDGQGNAYVYADIRWGRDAYAPADMEARLRPGCGVKVNPAHWDNGIIDKKQDKQAGKKTLQLKKLETAALAIGQQYEVNGGVLLPEILKGLLSGKLGKQAAPKKEIKQGWDFWFGKAIVDNQWSNEYAGIMRNWNNKLNAYDPGGSPEKVKSIKYIQDFIEWLHERGSTREKEPGKHKPLKDSYVNICYSYFKAVRLAAGLSVDFIKIKAVRDDEQIEPLTWEEIAALWAVDLSNVSMYTRSKKPDKVKARNNKLGLVRDRYIFVCLQGPRFSDTALLDTVNIVKQQVNGREIDVLRYRQKKTKGRATVALHPISMQIITKYQDNLHSLFPDITNAAANAYIKIVGKAAGLTRKVQKVYYSNRKRVVKTYELWETMTTHTARATWATNLLDAGMDITQVQMAGGWASLDTVMKYARVRQKSLHEATMAAWDKFKIEDNNEAGN